MKNTSSLAENHKVRSEAVKRNLRRPPIDECEGQITVLCSLPVGYLAASTQHLQVNLPGCYGRPHCCISWRCHQVSSKHEHLCLAFCKGDSKGSTFRFDSRQMESKADSIAIGMIRIAPLQRTAASIVFSSQTKGRAATRPLLPQAALQRTSRILARQPQASQQMMARHLLWEPATLHEGALL